MKLFAFLFTLSIIVAFTVSCGDDDDDNDDDSDNKNDDDEIDDDDTGDDDVDDDADDDDIPFQVISEYLLVDAPAPPPNPVTGDETPDVYNQFPMFRFRQDTGDEPPRSVASILILAAGYTAGANQLTFIAENMVELAEGDLEVWVLDRRCHLMEDVYASNIAEDQGDPWLAYNYYYNGAEVGGKTFKGYISGDDPSIAMTSEWGLDLQLAVYRRLFELIPESKRQTNVFFGGHSRGVYFVQAYTACEFDDGHMGKDDVAGLVFLDGGARYNSEYTQQEYLEDLQKIRDGRRSRTTTFSFLTPGIYTFLEVFSMATVEGLGDPNDPTLGPDGFFPSYGPFNLLLPIMTRFHDVTLTNEAFFGLVADDESGLMENFNGHMGTMTGGEICHDFLGDYPCENGATYSWIAYDETEPHELMNLQQLASNIFNGPSNNADPYYPARMDYDFYVADVLETEGTWRENYFNFYTSRMDAPVYAMGTELISEEGVMEAYRDQLPPVRGQDLPRTEYGFEIQYNNSWGHIDGLQADAQYNTLFPRLLDWIRETADGQVQIPAFGQLWTENYDPREIHESKTTGK